MCPVCTAYLEPIGICLGGHRSPMLLLLLLLLLLAARLAEQQQWPWPAFWTTPILTTVMSASGRQP